MQFLLKLSNWIKSYGHLSKILAYFSKFLPDLSLIFLIKFEKDLISPGSPINFRKSHEFQRIISKALRVMDRNLFGVPKTPLAWIGLRDLSKNILKRKKLFVG